MIQALLFFVFIVTMVVLISNVSEESISGVVILIFGVPIAVAYLLLAMIAQLLEPRVMDWSSECPECKSLNVGSKKQSEAITMIRCGGCGAPFFPKELNKHPPL